MTIDDLWAACPTLLQLAFSIHPETGARDLHVWYVDRKVKSGTPRPPAPRQVESRTGTRPLKDDRYEPGKRTGVFEANEGDGHNPADPTTWLSSSCDSKALADPEHSAVAAFWTAAGLDTANANAVWCRPAEGS